MNLLFLASADLKIVCYFSGWAMSRPKPWDTKVTDINPKMCTHLLYSFAGLDESTLTIKSLDPETDIEKGIHFLYV